MISERHEELTVLYLLGELPADDVRQLERELVGDEMLRAHIAETQDALAIHALASVDPVKPSQELRERILAGCSPQKEQQKAKRRPLGIALPWVFAVVLALLAAFLGYERERLGDDLANALQELENAASTREDLEQTVAGLREQASLDQLQLAGLKSQVENQPYFGFVVWKQEEGQGVLRVYNLPELNPTEKDYQLWVVDPQYGNPVDAGVFQVSEDGTAEVHFRTKQPVEKAVAFAVSLEKQGGVPVAEGPMMVLGN